VIIAWAAATEVEFWWRPLTVQGTAKKQPASLKTAATLLKDFADEPII
jgi:hypothetical protein